MKYFKFASLGLLFLFNIVRSQDISITGVVVNKNGEPVSGVYVELKEKSVSVLTDSLGVFQFDNTSIINKCEFDNKNVIFNSSIGKVSFYNNSNTSAEINIYNVTGKLVSKRIINNIQEGYINLDLFNSNKFGKGFYFVNLKCGDLNKVFKVNSAIMNVADSKAVKNNHTDNRSGRAVYNLVFTKDGFKEHNISFDAADDINLGLIEMLQYPQGRIANITENQIIVFGDSINISVTASDPDGDKIKVKFIVDSVVCKIDSVSPYEYTWNSLRGNIGSIPVYVEIEDRDSLIIKDSVNLSHVFNNERLYTYEVINTYDHDNTSYTQGLVHADGIFYEGSGLYGESVLRKVEVETGNIIKNINLGSSYFGEGITIWNDTILQLTWRENVIFTYDKETFTPFDTLYNPHDGWGITHDGVKLIISDGSSYLYFWNPHTISQFDSVRVYDKSGTLASLNELEYFYKKVFANIYQTKKIAIINPETGDVLGKIDFTGLWDFSDPQAEVLNGIAYDPIEDRIFITGKHWSNLYEVKLKLVN